MDKLEDLAKQASQLTFYDVKSYYNQARNAILNVSPIEAKVREATDPDEAWGASSTLMQDIAQATHSFQQFNEVMPLIWSRFHESEARQWRQVYKALTLLEYLVKNGSERVVDDARGHVSTIKMLRGFHYTDEKGKDQGINVRNRAKEIVELLSDVERIRVERRRAKANRNKYSGTGNDVAPGGRFGGSSSRYGGFGSEGSGRDDYGGRRFENQSSTSRRPEYDTGDVYRSSNSEQPEYDEYDAGEDDGRRFASRDRSAAARNVRDMVAPVKTAAPPHSSNTEKQKPAVVQDLFDFGDDDFGGNAAAMATPAATSTKTILDDDDDFADFQEAKVLPVAASEGVPPPNAPAAGQDVFNLLDNLPPAQAAPRASPAKPVVYSPVSAIPKPAANVVQSKGGFDDLWSLSLAGAGGISSPNGSSNTNKKSMLDLDREKTMNSLWGASPATKASSKSAFDDLLG